MSNRLIEEAKRELIAEIRHEIIGIVHEEMINLIQEAKLTADQKEYKKRKGAKTVDREEPGVTRVEALIKNSELGANTATNLTKLAKKIMELKKLEAEVKAELGTSKTPMLAVADELFDEMDKMLTRVLITPSVLITVNKASERASFDKDRFVELVNDQLSDMSEVIKGLMTQATSISQISPVVSIELNEEGLKDTFMKAWTKTKSWLSGLVKKIGTRQEKIEDTAVKTIGVKKVNNIKREAKKLAEMVRKDELSFSDAFKSMLAFTNEMNVKTA